MKICVKTIIVSVVILGLSISGVSCTKSSEPTPTQTSTTIQLESIYTNDTYGYTLKYPELWYVTDYGYIKVAHSAGFAWILINVANTNDTNYGTPEEVINYYLDLGKERTQDFVLLSKLKTYDFQGFPACEISFTFTSEGKPFLSRHIIIKRGTYFYELKTYTSQVNLYQANLDAIISSFRFQ